MAWLFQRCLLPSSSLLCSLGSKSSPVGGCNNPGTTGEITCEITAVALLAFDVEGCWPLCSLCLPCLVSGCA